MHRIYTILVYGLRGAEIEIISKSAIYEPNVAKPSAGHPGHITRPTYQPRPCRVVHWRALGLQLRPPCLRRAPDGVPFAPPDSSATTYAARAASRRARNEQSYYFDVNPLNRGCGSPTSERLGGALSSLLRPTGGARYRISLLRYPVTRRRSKHETRRAPRRMNKTAFSSCRCRHSNA